MRILRIIFSLLAVSMAGNLLAQDNNEGGSVVIQQDQRLQNIVSGEAPVVERKAENKSNVQRKTQQTADEKFNDFEKKIGTMKKMKGYRIQMYWGNSLRSDHLHAQRLGEKVTGVCPELNVYISFDQPHWRCRVGDFKKRDEAAKYLNVLRKIAPEAMIVRSEILIPQER